MPPSDPAVSRLPAPSPEAAAHSARLVQAIRAELEGGPMSFARFMELALYAPGLGYYSAGSRKLGADGDFVTAPEISPLFGRALARQCRQVLDAIGGGDILEFGAGTGALAADLLLELEACGSLPASYSILEISAELRARQQETLARRAAHLLEHVHWIDALPANGFRGVMLANEVLDAMPVHRFRVEGGELRELCVSWNDGRFAWSERAVDPALRGAVEQLQGEIGHAFADGYVSEIRLGVPAWIRSVADALACGAVLLIDYGYPQREYYLPERMHGTLMCHYRHRAHDDPLILVGLQDITAYVDFTAVAAAAQQCGLAVAGYTTQAYFLMACGLLELAAAAGTDARTQWEIASQVKRLTLPGEMGERFKVLALARALAMPLQGFGLRDMRERL